MNDRIKSTNEAGSKDSDPSGGTLPVTSFDPLIPVEAGPGLDVHQLKGRGRRLVVSLAGVGVSRIWNPKVEFVGTAGDGGENHVLFISDLKRSWLNGARVAERIIKLITNYRIQHDINDVVLLGNSMGGFAALVLADLVKVNTVIAFAPQFSAKQSLVPEETRWHFHRKKIRKWPFPDVGDLAQPETSYYLFHGDSDCEARHWLRFPWHARLNHFILRGLGHDVAARMQKRRLLQQIFRKAVAHKPRAVRQTLEKSFLGRQFTAYRREHYHREFPDLLLTSLALPQPREELT